MVVLTRVLVIACVALTGCFSPALDDRFQCAADGACPPGLRCAADHVCREPSSSDAGTATDLSLHVATDLAVSRDLATSCTKKTCDPNECGNALDGCGGQISCGACKGQPKTCGGGGANLCGNGFCVPTTCQARGATCGLVSDGCANVLDCGSCKNGGTCGSDNQCS